MLLASVRVLLVMSSCPGAEYRFANHIAWVISLELIEEKLWFRFCFKGASVESVGLDWGVKNSEVQRMLHLS